MAQRALTIMPLTPQEVEALINLHLDWEKECASKKDYAGASFHNERARSWQSYREQMPND